MRQREKQHIKNLTKMPPKQSDVNNIFWAAVTSGQDVTVQVFMKAYPRLRREYLAEIRQEQRTSFPVWKVTGILIVLFMAVFVFNDFTGLLW